MDYLTSLFSDFPLLKQVVYTVVTPIVILVVGWCIAKVLAWCTKKALLRVKADKSVKGISDSLSKTVYWLVLLLVLPAVLEVLNLQGLLEPVQTMVDKLLGHLPNVLAAGLILFVGTLVARIVKEVVTNLCRTANLDGFVEKMGAGSVLSGMSLSTLLGHIVNILIIIPVFIAALQALSIEAIAGPAISMLQKVFDALPNIITAGFMLSIGLYIGNFCAKTIAQLLEGVGLNTFIEKAGITSLKPSPSKTVGHITLAAIMLFLSIEAANILQFERIATMLTEFTAFAGTIIIALIMMVLGLMLANKGSAYVQNKTVARVVHIVIIAFVAGMSLDYTGLAPEGLMNNVFSLAVASAAVAAAIAFGIGGRDIAKKKLEQWF